MINGCGREKYSTRMRCWWHHLAAQPAGFQEVVADQRLDYAQRQPGFESRARVPAAEWPTGERWCSGCQSFVPLFYVSGSRCKACASRAAHLARIEKTYDMPASDYAVLLAYQGGVCWICGRRSPSRRLAVDHDHVTGAVRGLLCPDPDRGCNKAILGNIRDLEMARRIPAYLEDPPYARMQRGAPA